MTDKGNAARSRGRNGQGLVEFALILPILLLVLIGLLEFGRILFIYVNVANAAREGARYGVVHPTDLGGISNHVTEYLTLVPAVAPNVRYDHGPGTAAFTDSSAVESGDRVGVQIQYAVQPLTPLIQPFMPDGLDLTTESWRTIQYVRTGATSTPAGSAPPGALFTDTPTPEFTETPTPTSEFTPTYTPTPTMTPTPAPTVAPIVINPVDLGDVTVLGTAAPGRAVTLLVAQTGLQRTVTVQSDGTFTFSDLHEMVCGYTIVVSGYGQQAYATVCAGATPTPTPTQTAIPSPTPTPSGAYIFIDQACLDVGAHTVTLHGRQFASDGAPKMAILLDTNEIAATNSKWPIVDGSLNVDLGIEIDALEPSSHSLTLQVYDTSGKNVVETAETVIQVCQPVLMPDLVITDLQLLDTPPLSSYQPLNAQITIRNAGEKDVTSLFWVQFYGDYGEYIAPEEWNFIQQYGFTNLAAQTSVSFTMVMREGYAELGGHQIAAEIDAWEQIDESDETNNLYVGDIVDIELSGPTPEPTPQITPEAVGTVFGQVDGAPFAMVSINCYPPVAPAPANASGIYSLLGVPVGTWVVTAEQFVNGEYYFGSRTVIVTEGTSSRADISLDSFSVAQ